MNKYMIPLFFKLNMNFIKYVVPYLHKFHILNLSLAVVPTKLTIKLNGTLKKLMNFIEGIYILGPNKVNGKVYWIQENGCAALWNDGNWNIGNTENLGSSKVYMYSPDESVVPTETISWIYYDTDDKLIETTDVLILPGQGISK